MCVRNYLDTVQLIPYIQVNVCTKLPRHSEVNTFHAGKCVQYYLDTVKLVTYMQVNVCTKIPRKCAVKTVHARKIVYKTT